MTVLTEDIQDPEELVVDTNTTTEEQKTELGDEDKNWKAFLEKRKEEQKENLALQKKLEESNQENARREREIENLKIAFKSLAEKKEEPSNYDYDGDDQKKIIQDEVNRVISKRDKENEERETAERIRKEAIEIKEQMPDLMDVCSHDNIAYLEYYHPEIAIPLGAMPNGFMKTKMAYQAVKKHVKMGMKEKDKIEKNLAKPKSLHSAISNEGQQEESSGNMSDKKKTETWNKMQRLMSGQDED